MYTFKELEAKFEESKYNRVYRDDGIVLFEGVWSTTKSFEWLNNFQEGVNKLFQSKYLEFTMVIWEPNNSESVKEIKLNRKQQYTRVSTSLICTLK